MYEDAVCEYCAFSFPFDRAQCPHCARPSRFPNVVLAERPEETSALLQRYQTALKKAEKRGSGEVARNFEAKVGSASEAILCRGEIDSLGLGRNDRQLFGTYYGLFEGGVKLPATDDWRGRRELADTVLFGSFIKNEIRHAALSLHGEGLQSFGPCSWVLAERMIDFRASVFEENSANFLKRKGLKNIDKPPVGFRANWASRGLLALAKLADRLKKSTQEAEFPQVLLAAGATSEADDFVEVHIYGSMSYRTFDRLVVRKDRVESWFEEALKTMAPDLQVELR